MHEKIVVVVVMVVVVVFFGGVNRQKRVLWIVCRFKRGLCKRRGYVFEVGGGGVVETPIYTMSWRSLLINTNIQSK